MDIIVATKEEFELATDGMRVLVDYIAPDDNCVLVSVEITESSAKFLFEAAEGSGMVVSVSDIGQDTVLIATMYPTTSDQEN